jgi:hypothetical protein
VPRVLRRVVSCAGLVVVALAATAPTARAGEGGGNGGVGNGGVWAATWWDGNPQGPGPYIPGVSGTGEVCTWLDVGGTIADMTSAMASAGFPPSFWPADNSGYSPGAIHVIEWAIRTRKGNASTDHFDMVACPSPSMVPGPIGGAYTTLPPAQPPTGSPQYIWLYWDTVPDPPSKGLPAIIGSAYDSVPLPTPAISTSPSTVQGIPDASIVNFPTWFWIGSSSWHTVVARAAGGGLVATVWATPVSVTWKAAWDFTSPSEDPESGVDLSPTALDLVCTGPGTPYSSSVNPSSPSPTCGTTFTQSTFGTRSPLSATVKWDVTWALTDAAGVVGGEGTLPPLYVSASIPLRVLQIESVVSGT